MIVKSPNYIITDEIILEDNVYLLTFNYKGIQYDAKYAISSSDGIRRSGVLRLGKELYKNIDIKAGDKLIIKLKEDGSYTLR